jgi:hypothetical protein
VSPREQVNLHALLLMMPDSLSNGAAQRGSILTLPLEHVGTKKPIAIADLLLQTLLLQGYQQKHALPLKSKAHLPERRLERPPEEDGNLFSGVGAAKL